MFGAISRLMASRWPGRWDEITPENYKKTWPAGFRSFLWADLEPRTCATADALKAGFQDGGISATVDSRFPGPDPLFHSFDAHCGTPNPAKLAAIAGKISDNSESWIKLRFGRQFAQLYGVLACADADNCELLNKVADNSASACISPTPGAAPPRLLPLAPAPSSGRASFPMPIPVRRRSCWNMRTKWRSDGEVCWGRTRMIGRKAGFLK